MNVYRYTYVYFHVNMHLHTNVCVGIWVWVHVCMWVRMCTSPHVQGCQGSQARKGAVGNGGDGVAVEVSGQAREHDAERQHTRAAPTRA